MLDGIRFLFYTQPCADRAHRRLPRPCGNGGIAKGKTAVVISLQNKYKIHMLY